MVFVMVQDEGVGREGYTSEGLTEEAAPRGTKPTIGNEQDRSVVGVVDGEAFLLLPPPVTISSAGLETDAVAGVSMEGTE